MSPDHFDRSIFEFLDEKSKRLEQVLKVTCYFITVVSIRTFSGNSEIL